MHHMWHQFRLNDQIFKQMYHIHITLGQGFSNFFLIPFDINDLLEVPSWYFKWNISIM